MAVDTDTIVDLLVAGDPAAGVDQGNGRWLLSARPVTMELFDGQTLTVDPLEAVATWPSVGDEDGNDISPTEPTVSWIGLVGEQGDGGSVALTLSPLPDGGYALEGSIDLADQLVIVTPQGGDLHVLESIDRSYPWPEGDDVVPIDDGEKAASDGEPLAEPVSEGETDDDEGGVGIQSHSSSFTIDVLVARATGVTVGATALVDQVNAAFAATNDMPIGAVMVRTRSVSYGQHASDMNEDFDALLDGDGTLGVLHTERTQYEADIVRWPHVERRAA